MSKHEKPYTRPKRSWEEIQEMLKLWRRASRSNKSGKHRNRGAEKREAIRNNE